MSQRLEGGVSAEWSGSQQVNQLIALKAMHAGRLSGTGTPVAVVVSGVAGERPTEIINDLEKAGYSVQYFKYNQLDSLPDAQYVSLAVGHSAGATRVELAYGGSSVSVVALSSPSRIKADNISHFSNKVDPVGMMGMHNPFGDKSGQFMDLTKVNVHDKNVAWNVAKGELDLGN